MRAGLEMTETGEILYHTANEVLVKLESVRLRLSETKDTPSGLLRVTTTVGARLGLLTERLPEFMDLYPDIQLQLILTNAGEEKGTGADTRGRRHCAIPASGSRAARSHPAQAPFTVHSHLYASPGYVTRHGRPQSIDELDRHRMVTLRRNGGPPISRT